MTEQEIHSNCKTYKIKNYTINDDMSLDVDGSVNICSYGKADINELPLTFNKISGDFKVISNRLTTLKGCPKIVGGNFDCTYNQLTSLEGCPEQVGLIFSCSFNQLTSLEHCKFDFVAINFSGNQIMPQSLFELDDTTYEKAIEKFDELSDKHLGYDWHNYYFQITKSEFNILKRKYTIDNIINS